MNQTELILNAFEGFRMTPLAIDQYDAVGKQKLRERISPFVTANQPIKFSMMGLPFKSPNTRDKVLGVLPDMAEQATMENFKAFNDAISSVYAPGIKLSMISDGLAFNNVMEVSDIIVDQYQEAAEDMAKIAPVQIFNLRDFYNNGISLNTMRGKLVEQFGITNEELERRILMDADVNMLYKGMIRFMNLDLAIRDYSSNTQLQKAAKKMARDMMFMNEAYSKLVQNEFSDHIRLSMHPSVNNGTKYSFQLIKGENIWTSAWHCALLLNSRGQFETIHRKDAEAAGYNLIYNNSQAWGYQA